jgi:hypothetical protein
MTRFLTACIVSLLVYWGLSAFVLTRPLEYGTLRDLLARKVALAAQQASPKILILAGSNGLYSHRCETIAAVLAMPCVNGAIAVGIGLDDVFARFTPTLHQGDIVYMPLEEAQYGRDQAATETGPDAAILFRHDRGLLTRLPPRRLVYAAFAVDLPGLVMSLAENLLVALHFPDPRLAFRGEINRYGDHIGHTAEKGRRYQPLLAIAHPGHATPEDVRAGYGASLVAAFVRQMAARGVLVIGGLPAGFDDSPPDPGTIAALQQLYTGNGGQFITLPGLSLYPRADFFDSPDHLDEEQQIRHSRAVAAALAGFTRTALTQAMTTP